jgi:hypothetical protein
MEDIIPTGKFNLAQLELLRMFARQYPENVWAEIRDLLSKYFMEKASQEMDTLFEQRGWSDDKINEWLQEHMRTPYK